VNKDVYYNDATPTRHDATCRQRDRLYQYVTMVQIPVTSLKHPRGV